VQVCVWFRQQAVSTTTIRAPRFAARAGVLKNRPDAGPATAKATSAARASRQVPKLIGKREFDHRTPRTETPANEG